MAWVRLGTVVRPVGLDGRVGVAGTEGALARMTSVALRKEGQAELERKVLSAGPQGRVWWLRLEGVADRTAAEALQGREVWGRREEKGEPGEGRHFWVDLQLENHGPVALDGVDPDRVPLLDQLPRQPEKQVAHGDRPAARPWPAPPPSRA